MKEIKRNRTLKQEHNGKRTGEFETEPNKTL